MTKKALLIVDVQKDFIPGGALAVPEGDAVVPIINAVQKAFSCIVATKDWHPVKHISFASSHGKKPGEVVLVRGLKQELWPDHCIQGTDGAEFAPGLQIEKIKKVFFKGTDPLIDSYSTFYDNAHMRTTGLGEYLKGEGVEVVFLAGLATDYCVKYSMLDAQKLGFKTAIITDACRGIDLREGDVKRAIQEMESAGALMVTSRELLSQAFQS